jgi:glycosyltransferase involved in cell wall biosynthesis
VKATFIQVGVGETKAFSSSDFGSSRILYLIGQLGLGGSERQLHCLLERMDRSRLQTAVFVWNLRQDDPYVARIKALGVPLDGFSSQISAVGKMKMFRKIVSRLRPDVIHSYSFHTNLAASWAAKGTKAIAVGSVRSDFLAAKKDCGLLLGKLSARWPRSQIFNSFAAAENAQCTRDFFVPGQLFVVRNGLDLQYYRMTLLPSGGRVCIVGVGSLLPVKRWDRLLAAGLELKRKGYDALIRIAGNGPLRGSLQQQAQDFGLGDRLEFMGEVDDIPKFLSNATFLVHTSESEGCPNVIMEAQACGRAVVAMDSGDISKLVEDGKTGFVVERGNDDSFVQRMASLITDYNLCRAMGEAGRMKAEREFGLDRLVHETLAAYRAAGWNDSSGADRIFFSESPQSE